MRSVIGRIHDDGVVRNSEVVQLLQQFADVIVMSRHDIVVESLPRPAGMFRGAVGSEMHGCRVEPQKERLTRLVALVDEAESSFGNLIVNRFHAFLGQGTSVLDRLLAYPAKTGIDGWIILVGGGAVHDPSRPEFLEKTRIFGIVDVFRFLFRVQVIEVAEELVKSMRRGQVFIPVAKMVLAELAGRVAKRFEHFRDGGIFCLQAESRPRHADLRHARAEWVLASDEGGTSSRAALLAVVVGKGDTFVGNAVDVWRAITHQAPAVPTDVPHANVIAPYNQDIGLFRSHTCPFVKR